MLLGMQKILLAAVLFFIGAELQAAARSPWINLMIINLQAKPVTLANFKVSCDGEEAIQMENFIVQIGEIMVFKQIMLELENLILIQELILP
jgi:hypothetical protein